MINGLGVKVAAETLEVAGYKDEICVIDLQSCISSSAQIASDSSMSVFDLVKSGIGICLPAMKRLGGH